MLFTGFVTYRGFIFHWFCLFYLTYSVIRGGGGKYCLLINVYFFLLSFVFEIVYSLLINVYFADDQ